MARRRGNRWQADFKPLSGDRMRPAFATEAAAKAWEANAALAELEGREIPSPQSAKIKASPTTTLGDLFDHVSRTHWSGMRSGSTAILNGRDVVRHFGRNKDVSQITASDVAEMTAAFADRGLSASYINRKTAALSTMLRTAKHNNSIQAVPHIRWNREIKTKFRHLTDLEERAVLAYWEAGSIDLIGSFAMFLVDTGARCFTEGLPVHWDAFGPDFKSVTFWHTKTNKPRTVPLTKRVRQRMVDTLALYPNSSGPFERLTKSTLRGQWDLMRQALKLHDVTPHTLRHTCCTRLVLGGADVKRVMEWMGHDTIVTTMRYMQIRPTSLEDIVGLLER